MITKDEARNKLVKSGYTVVDENSVLTILIPENGNIKNTVKDIKELFIKIGYEASFGVKQHKIEDGEQLSDSDEDYLDEPDSADLQNKDEQVKIDPEDMDMMLNEDSVQFSLEDFGMM